MTCSAFKTAPRLAGDLQ